MEIGRATQEVEPGTDDAKFINFDFQQETDMQLISKVVLDIKK